MCLCAGAFYWKEDREKRKLYRGLLDEKRAREKREAWIRELEIRDAEDEREREKRRKRRQGLNEMTEEDIEAQERALMAMEGARQGGQGAVRGSTAVSEAVTLGANSSPFEDGRLRELVGGRGILGQAMALWWSSLSS